MKCTCLYTQIYSKNPYSCGDAPAPSWPRRSSVHAASCQHGFFLYARRVLLLSMSALLARRPFELTRAYANLSSRSFISQGEVPGVQVRSLKAIAISHRVEFLSSTEELPLAMAAAFLFLATYVLTPKLKGLSLSGEGLPYIAECQQTFYLPWHMQRLRRMWLYLLV